MYRAETSVIETLRYLKKSVSVTIFDLGICFQIIAFQIKSIFLLSLLTSIAPSAAVVVFDSDCIAPSDRAI